MRPPAPVVGDVVILERLPCPPHASGTAARPEAELLNFRIQERNVMLKAFLMALDLMS